MSDGLSLSSLQRELEELQKDYIAFSSAYDILRSRLFESAEMPRDPELHMWSGSRAVCGSMELSIHAIERTINEYNDLINKVKSGEIVNTDRPALRSI